MLDLVTARNGTILLKAHSSDQPSACPDCQCPSSHVHSRYCRKLLDLPWQGQSVRIELTVRKLYCDKEECQRRVFTERLPKIVARYARKTDRLADALRELAFLAGGEAAARIARAFGLAISPDALLDSLHKMPTTHSFPTPKVLGVDDFAFRKGRRYGTILVDLERRCPVDLLPDREADSLVTWLQAHPGVEVISRDRGAAYSEGATRGAPNAVQVADRFHLVKNLGDALENFLGRQYVLLTKTAAAVSVETQSQQPELPDREPLPPAPKQLKEKQDRAERRQNRFETVKKLQEEGLSQRDIARRTGHSRRTVQKLVHADCLPEGMYGEWRRSSSIDPFVAYIKARWQEGYCNATWLHQQVVAQGFCGSVNIVQRLVQPWREKRYGRAGPIPFTVPSPRRLRWLLFRNNAEDSKNSKEVNEEEQSFMKRLLEACPAVATARDLVQRFCTMVRERDGASFALWMEEVAACGISELVGFARGLRQDESAVKAALSSEWSNGQVEGQVNRLKFIKRSMYGSASFGLLKARVLHQPIQQNRAVA